MGCPMTPSPTNPMRSPLIPTSSPLSAPLRKGGMDAAPRASSRAAASSSGGAPESDQEEPVERPGVVGVDEDEEHDRVEEQMHRHDVGEGSRHHEDEALQEREGDREERAPRLIAQLPQERHEDDRLQEVRLPVGAVPPQEREDGADEEELVPDADGSDADEETGDEVRRVHDGPVRVDARGDEVERQDQPGEHEDEREPRPLEGRPPPSPTPGEADRVVAVR